MACSLEYFQQKNQLMEVSISRPLISNNYLISHFLGYTVLGRQCNKDIIILFASSVLLVAMGEETCRTCRSWEEEIYWTHFQYTQFSQFLCPGFNRRLEIPENFSRNMKKKLLEMVTLNGPSGCAWRVGLTTNDDTLYFDHGWDQFVKDNYLQEKDLLVFKYNGRSQFDVLIFDGLSLCEKAASYFVRKCGHGESSSGCHTGKGIGESSSELVPASACNLNSPMEKTHIDDDSTPPSGRPATSETFKKNTPTETTVTDPFGVGQIIRAEEPLNKRTKRELKFPYPSHVSQCVKNEEPCSLDEETETKPDIVHSFPSSSRGRLVSEEKKQNALKLAQTVMTNDGFVVVMKPSHVYRKFFMVIPSSWIVKRLSNLARHKVILRVEGNTWHTNFLYRKYRKSGGLSAGWKNFVTDNNLNEFDICLFEPGSPLNDSFVLDVQIFRVA
ncbi:hypothetical protein K2173_007576 [Erythroxylum novogranatense]|uniref:TF-B3 domain-containing protein n=1 Tax=Erythroxylum novogranatense TaxID=1862640 RepID=A0AAV8T6K5_9ROSI|nr:hypothetical protein K2173_007576 [Erythroxylum novogranatense]